MILMLEESLAEQKTFFISHIQTEYVLLLKMGQAATEKKIQQRTEQYYF